MTEETKHVKGEGVPQERHSLLCSDCGVCPEAPATEKRRREEAGAPPVVGARGGEEQARPWRERRGRPWTPQRSSAQRNHLSLLLPQPPQPGRVLWVPREWMLPRLLYRSGSEGTCHKASPIFLGLQFSKEMETAPAAEEAAPKCQTTSSWSRKRTEPVLPAFYKKGGNVAGSQGGHGHSPWFGAMTFWVSGEWGLPWAPWNFLLGLIPDLLGLSGRRSRKPEYSGGWGGTWIIKIT